MLGLKSRKIGVKIDQKKLGKNREKICGVNQNGIKSSI